MRCPWYSLGKVPRDTRNSPVHTSSCVAHKRRREYVYSKYRVCYIHSVNASLTKIYGPWNKLGGTTLPYRYRDNIFADKKAVHRLKNPLVGFCPWSGRGLGSECPPLVTLELLVTLGERLPSLCSELIERRPSLPSMLVRCAGSCSDSCACCKSCCLSMS